MRRPNDDDDDDCRDRWLRAKIIYFRVKTVFINCWFIYCKYVFVISFIVNTLIRYHNSRMLFIVFQSWLLEESDDNERKKFEICYGKLHLHFCKSEDIISCEINEDWKSTNYFVYYSAQQGLGTPETFNCFSWICSSFSITRWNNTRHSNYLCSRCFEFDRVRECPSVRRCTKARIINDMKCFSSIIDSLHCCLIVKFPSWWG